MKKVSILGIFLLAAVCMNESCVPRSKFTEQGKRLARYESENDSLLAANEQLTVDNAEFKSRIEALQKDIAALQADSLECARKIAAMQSENRQLQGKIQEMTMSMQALKKGAEQEASKLTMQLEGMQNDLNRREQDLQKLSGDLQKLSTELQDKQTSLTAMEAELEKRNRRMRELERMVARQDSSVKALKEKISSALVGLENNGLTVSIREGKVYVSMDEKLLFKSGSIVVDPAGVKALKKLVKVLEQNPDINITIEGHTDNVPLAANASMADNWDLSVKRATSIVRILLDGTKIKPSRLTAAGRGEYVPVDKANTPAARQKNRRTEIILMPKLDELYQILK